MSEGKKRVFTHVVLHKKWKPAHRKQLYLLSLVPRDLVNVTRVEKKKLGTGGKGKDQ